ncbi:MAG: 2-iminoacetate synthase ThiH [Syntrophobacterales bacterium CG_4_8_14_3_um_filter_58_8]|nr:MAG: thiamine biosynthesis protein ThiH [Syntrophaceae bacterium CG2_30_58_14]PIV06525.1 MAG: 2-iminoacetate synthase ThiH [Syntrophobacterales bacterium CG03_land_8_20_14_0_80_58_14]PJC71737.1 MAG: 2-iminoacetate synthase ThiH [Syntrophobacterales bacterium CG_4_8_14_3_um_filter_58_8]
MSFYDVIHSYDWDEIQKEIDGRSREDVERALAARTLGFDDLLSLLSPAAEPFLEEMAQRAHRLTVQRFGLVMGMFAPLYLSNVCTNRCVYCGFNAGNAITRLTLTLEDAETEGESLRRMGFHTVLLLSGEAPQIITEEYLKRVLGRLRPHFSSIGIEMFPMTAGRYRELIGQGVDGLTVFQETYDEASYGEFHPEGRKSDYRWRLETPERGGAAGFRRLGIGALLGLNNWRVEGFFVALHASHLLRTCWKSQLAISFPRLCSSAGGYEPCFPVTDCHLVQLICALRLFLPDVGFTLSTRELPALRDCLIPLGITTMSAGSHTEPGGYSRPGVGGAQFEVADGRSPGAVAEVLRRTGYEPVWKEWDGASAFV